MYISAWWRSVQEEHGEDLVQLNGVSGSFEHLAWTTELTKIGRRNAQLTAPDQCIYILYSIRCIEENQRRMPRIL